MARWKHATAILDAARRWKQRCLLECTSVFTDETLWTRSNFEQIHTYFVERPDTGSDSFEEKALRQLEHAPPEAKRLWAEVTWIYNLVSSNRKLETKLQSIKTVWERSEASLPEEHWALGEVLAGGVSHPGPDWNRWREFRFIVTTMIAWFSLSADERKSRLADPWRFAEWLDGQDGSNHRQFRHKVLFLLFPDSFERMLTTSHKRDAVKAFSGKQAEEHNIAGMSHLDLDRALLAIRERLEGEHPETEIDFYEPPLREVWRRTPAPPPNPGEGGDDEDESWYRERFGEAEVWAIAPGEGARLWRQFRDESIAAIGYDREGDLGDLSQYNSRDAVRAAAVEKGFGENPVHVALAAWQFSHEIKVGDILLAKKGLSTFLGWGKVTGDYRPEPERPEYRHIRSVEWHVFPAPIKLPGQDKTVPKALTRFTDFREWLRHIFKKVDGGPPPGLEPYGISEALSELFIDDAQFRRKRDSFGLRKNLIIQGPPGAGKTFISKRLA